MSDSSEGLGTVHSSEFTKEKLPLRERLARLATFLPVFEDPDFVFGRWVQPPPHPDGKLSFAWCESTPKAEGFVQAAYDLGFVATDFDWPAWAGSDEAQALVHDPKLVARASVDQLIELLTVSIRGDRFCEGQLLALFESGVLTAILRRAAELQLGG